MDRLNLSSSAAETRVGRAVNRTYRKVTTAIGMQMSRRGTVSQAVTMGVSTVVFSNVEKIIDVWDRSVSPYAKLTQVTLDEIRESMPYQANDHPCQWAAHSHTSDSVTIEFDRVPQTAFTLYADAHQVVADLSGSNEPAFPESFHDVIIEGVLADEYRKLEKPQMAVIAQKEFERILSDLKMWVAKGGADIWQSKLKESSSTRSGGSGGGSFDGAQSWTQTGLVTFDRDPSAPFAVTASSAKVDNLNADKLDGYDESEFFKLADNETVAGNTLFTGTAEFDNTVNFDGAVDASGGSILLPQAAVPAQTAEGSIVWDTNDDLLTVGTGAARKTMVDTDSSQTLTNKSIVATQLTGTIAVARLGSGTHTVVSSSTTSNQNDWAPGLSGDTVIFWSGASNITVTGFAGGVSGQVIVFKNTGTAVTTFSHNSGSSSAGNKLFNIATSAGTPVAGKGYAVYQYDGTQWQLVAHDQGAWITPTFAAGDYTAITAGTWTVASGDVANQQYRLAGRALTVMTSLATTTVAQSGGNPVQLSIANGAWGGFTISNTNLTAGVVNDNAGGTALGVISVTAAGTSIRLFRAGTAQFSNSTDQTGFDFVFTFEID